MTRFGTVAEVEPLIVSVSGLRGVVGASLTPEVAARYAAAFVATLPAGPIVIGRDGRESGPLLAAAIARTVQAAGRTLLDAGIASTPTVGIVVRDQRAAGGIQISASHNPARYNGMKLFSAAGRVLPAAAGGDVLGHFHALDGRMSQTGSAVDDPKQQQPVPAVAQAERRLVDGTAGHLQRVLAIVNVEAIRRCRPRVWLDSCHGAGSRMALPLFDALGCEVICVGAEADGLFSHEPEPTAENLGAMLPAIPAAAAEIGFFQDPDADRLAIATAAGRYIGEELTLGLAVEAVLSQRPGPIVVNCSTSSAAAGVAARLGSSCHVAAVGEANVVDRMLEVGAVLGGEGNGGVIDPRVGLVRDSFVAMALVLDRMCRGGRLTPLESLVAGLPQFVMRKTKVAVDSAARGSRLEDRLEAVAAAFPEAEASRLDGLRLDWPGGWLLVRASNTEPIIRIIAESGTNAEVDAAISRARTAILKETSVA